MNLAKLRLPALMLALAFVLTGCFHQPQVTDNTNSDGTSQAVPADNSNVNEMMVNDDDSMMEDDNKMMDDDKMEGEDAMMAEQSFTVDSFGFGYSMEEIRVKKGTKVTINLTNSQGFHDWVVDEFNAATEQINAGETDSVTFVADKTGTFEYYCSVGNHRAMGMVGKLIVE